jgi:hypothetical protein
VLSVTSDPSLYYNESVRSFVARLDQTGDRIRELGQVVEGWDSKMIGDKMIRKLHNDLK